MLSHQYKDSNYEGKMVSWPYYYDDENPCIWKDDFHIEPGPRTPVCCHEQVIRLVRDAPVYLISSFGM